MRYLILILFLGFQIGLIAQTREFTKVKKGKEYQTSTGLKMLFYKVSDSEEFADSGDVVEVHYIGKFTDGKIFDSSYNRNSPISVTLGQGRVIKGWEEALLYMRDGDSALVTIPPKIGYGEYDYASIPGNSTLVFTMKVVSLQKRPKPYDVEGIDTVKLENGLSYIVVKKGEGEGCSKNDSVNVKYSGYFINGTKFDSSFDHPGGKPFKFIIGRKQVIAGWDLGVLGMKAGEKRRLIIPYQMAYGEQGRNPVIPPKSDLIFDVELVNFGKVEPPKPYNVEGKDTISTASGLRYIVVEPTNGRQVVAGDTIVADYTGYFSDGSIFDSSVERNDSIVLIIGKGMVIKGWDEGIQLMKEGEKVRLIIPYYLAYGENGRPPIIPPKAQLIFDVHLRKIGL